MFLKNISPGCVRLSWVLAPLRATTLALDREVWSSRADIRWDICRRKVQIWLTKNFAGGCTTSVQWVANPSSAAQISPALSPAAWCVFGVLYLEGNLLSGTSLTSTAHRTHTYSSLFVWFVQKILIHRCASSDEEDAVGLAYFTM